MTQLEALAAEAGGSGAREKRTSVTEVHRGGLTKTYPDRDASAEPIPYMSRDAVRSAVAGCLRADHVSHGERLVGAVTRTRRGMVYTKPSVVGLALRRDNCPFELDSV
jgi:hypothetical protein